MEMSNGLSPNAAGRPPVHRGGLLSETHREKDGGRLASWLSSTRASNAECALGVRVRAPSSDDSLVRCRRSEIRARAKAIGVARELRRPFALSAARRQEAFSEMQALFALSSFLFILSIKYCAFYLFSSSPQSTALYNTLQFFLNSLIIPTFLCNKMPNRIKGIIFEQNSYGQ